MKYSHEQLVQLASDIRSSSQRIVQSGDDLKGYVAQLTSEWEGQAKVDYTERQNRWNDAQADLANILETIAKVVEDGAIAMTEMDAMNARSWVS
ncbi:WXG100 family type VII secretion target [Nocardia cyriacigeorgica]|uniref:WXG100 family type VII secretion target n=1 Tax=Nocardia cyriacigeorgica TaxID=135487 RepID=UPI0013D54BF8|nr:WXG100 family type VII secretion target [Nocardia cyriacigeorgica]MBF6456583.1 WXG100 family type VII secretion target [Nocardia cyriacigeorgica]MBF6481190.1 WXG100 family type VII secretion target [Nocardia cyriacigeorgica]MBF6551388.1 WXG100 family type VII secretion target [Nocardia cyriacigeorgica]NEW28626.1 WXG100 family type VII secretion target [Nocardia cyriacigeorgica]